MSLNNFIATIWAARLLSNLNNAHVFAQEGVVNRDYEGEIKAGGDIVKINSIGRVTIGNYTKGTKIGSPETLTDAQRQLLIDQQKFFNFMVDDVDKAQTRPNVMDEAMKEAGYGLSDVADNFIAGLYPGVDAANIVGLGNDTTPLVPTATTMYEILVDMGVRLSEAKVPKAGRWAALPPWCYGLLQKDDRFVKAGTAKTDEVLRNGEVGTAAGFRILESNNVPNTAGAKYKIMAGHPMAISYAEQIVSVEGYRPEELFSDALKGLHVYGGKLVRPSAIAVATLSKS